MAAQRPSPLHVSRVVDYRAPTDPLSPASRRQDRFRQALAKQHMTLEACEGDGNCLFRAVAHQVYGTQDLHPLVRGAALDYMVSRRVLPVARTIRQCACVARAHWLRRTPVYAPGGLGVTFQPVHGREP